MQVFIHVGPGKTGSSAIQKWMNDNTARLREHGYFYPQHSVDENGISSGNALSIFEYDNSGVLRFSDVKAQQIVEQAKEKGCNNLVLSSEAFIARFEPILSFFPASKVIFYLRNPLECAESLYNQSVKRHYNTEQIRAPRISYDRLIKLTERVSEMTDTELKVRLYGKQFFTGGDIVSDFLDAINLKASIDASSTAVNHSYSFEALEFKRALNFFPSKTFHAQLDQHLQAYPGGKRSFSLLSPDVYKKSVQNACKHISELNEYVDVSLTKMQASIAAKPQQEYTTQHMRPEQIKEILSYLQSKNPQLLNEIRFIVERALLPENINQLFAAAFDLLCESSRREKRKIFRFGKNTAIVKPLTIDPIEHFKSLINRLAGGSNDKLADRLRDISFFFESKGDYIEAVRFMQYAKLRRTHGKIINQKLKEYAEKIINDQRSLS
jgi:hypothetical protein